MLPACLAAVNGDRIPAGFVGKDAGKGEVIGDAVLSVLEEAVREIRNKTARRITFGCIVLDAGLALFSFNQSCLLPLVRN